MKRVILSGIVVVASCAILFVFSSNSVNWASVAEQLPPTGSKAATIYVAEQLPPSGSIIAYNS